jgi:hypothetical protein
MTIVALSETLPADEQVEPRPPVLPPLDELDDELDELELEDDELDDDELELEDELLVVVGAYEHQADVTPEYAPPKFELEHATELVKVPYTKLPDLPRAT